MKQEGPAPPWGAETPVAGAPEPADDVPADERPTAVTLPPELTPPPVPSGGGSAAGGSGGGGSGGGGSGGGPRPEPAGRSGFYMGSPFGVPVFVGPTWFVVAAIITVTFAPSIGDTLSLGASRYVVAFLFAVLLYASVLAHELSHSVVALRLGMRVRRITLHFLGGVSEIENEPDSPGREFAVAAAGPALSLVLAGVGWGLQRLVQYNSVPGLLAFTLTLANLLVATFNLLPGLPLDGGRLLRAGVWKLTGRPFAGTVAAAWGGRILGLVLIVAPIVIAYRSSSPSFSSVVWGFLIGGFVLLGASQALQSGRIREALPRLRLPEIIRPALAVTPDLPLAEALRRAEEASARALVIVDHDRRPTAVVGEAAVSAVPPQRRPWVAVGEFARALRPGMVLPIGLEGEALLHALRAFPSSEYVVAGEHGQVVGVLSVADVDTVFAGR